MENLKTKILSYTKIDDAVLESEMKNYRRIVLQKGETLLEPGHVATHMYYLEKGCISYHKEEEGEVKVLEFYTEDVYFTDLLSYVNQTLSKYYLKALEPCVVLAVDKKGLEKSFSNSHQLERFGRLSMQEAFTKLLSRVERMSIRSNEERYLRLVEKRPDLFQRVPNYLIASYLGITPVGLSKLRKRLSKV